MNNREPDSINKISDTRQVKEMKVLDISSENIDIFAMNDRGSTMSPLKRILENTNQAEQMVKPSFFRKISSVRNSSSNQLEEEIEFSEKKSIGSIDSEFSIEYINYPTKQKIIATVDKLLLNSECSDYDEYYTNIIFSGADFLKIAFSILEEFAYKRLQMTIDRLNYLMDKERRRVPLIISLEHKLIRFTNLDDVRLKANEHVYIKISNLQTIEKNSFLDRNPNNYKIYFLNNYEQVMSNNLRLGDKIIVDFGRGLFTISKIYYKNGKVIELTDEQIKEETKINIKYHLTNDYFNDTIENDFSLQNDEHFMSRPSFLKKNEKKQQCSEILYSEILQLVNNYFENKEIESISEIYKEVEIDYVEAIVNYDCYLHPSRPAQIFKKSILH